MRAGRNDLSNATWHKSSYSNGQGGDCLEVAGIPGAVPVRDSKRRNGPAIMIPPAAWTAFIEDVKRAEPITTER